MTEKQTDEKHDDLLDDTLQAFDSGGLGATVLLLTSIDNPALSGIAFDKLSRKLYHARKDVTNMVAVAEAGIAFCLDQAHRTEDADSAKTLKTTAKTIAFNAGANCWPGWGDDGIKIMPAHIQSGLKLAAVCRDLVRELQLGQKQVGNATWLIGALKLAAGEPTAALAEFQVLHRSAESTGDTVSMLTAAGYCAIARKATAATASAGANELELALRGLREFDSQEAKFFASQLVTADMILLAK